MRHLLAQRGPLYAEVASHVVDTTGRTVDEVTEGVLAILAHLEAAPEVA